MLKYGFDESLYKGHLSISERSPKFQMTTCQFSPTLFDNYLGMNLIGTQEMDSIELLDFQCHKGQVWPSFTKFSILFSTTEVLTILLNNVVSLG